MDERPSTPRRADRLTLALGAVALALVVAAVAWRVVVGARGDTTPTDADARAPATASLAPGAPGRLPTDPGLAASGRRPADATAGDAPSDGDEAGGANRARRSSTETSPPDEAADGAEDEGSAVFDFDGPEPEPSSAEAATTTPRRPPLARLGLPARWADDEPVFAVAFSPDARQVVSAGESRVIFVRDRATGRVVARLEGHTGGVSEVAVSPDGTTVLSGGYDATARLWDLASRTALHELKPGGGTIHSVAFDATGRRGVTAGTFDDVVLWDLATGTELRRFPFESDGNGADVSPDGGRLAAVSSTGLLRVWDVGSGTVLGETHAHDGAGGEVAFLPGTDQLLTCGEDKEHGMVKLWTRDAASLVRAWVAHDARISNFAVVPDGLTVVTGGWDGRVRAWRIADGERLWDRAVTTELIVAMSVTSDGRAVAVGARDGMTRLLDVATGAPVVTDDDPLEGHAGAVHDLVFVGPRLVSTGQDATIRVWDLAARAWTRLFRSDGVVATHLAAATSSDRFVAAGPGRIRCCDAVSGAELRRVEVAEAAVTGLATARAVDTVFSVYADQGLRIDDFGPAAPRVHLPGRVGDVVASPTEPLVAHARGDGGIDLLGLDGVVVRRIAVDKRGDGRLLAWFPDGGSLLVSRGDFAWRVAGTTGAVLARYVGLDGVRDGAVTPDGRGVVLGDGRGSVALFDAAAGTMRRRFEGHKTAVTSVAVHPDGRTAVSGGAEGALFLWDLTD